jgi:hypothetical protein
LIITKLSTLIGTSMDNKMNGGCDITREEIITLLIAEKKDQLAEEMDVDADYDKEVRTASKKLFPMKKNLTK